MNTTHALLSPSSAHRWMVCTAAPAFCHDIVEPEPSVFAETGSRLHAAAAQRIALAMGRSIEDGMVSISDDEAREIVEPYVQAVLEARDGDRCHVEHTIPIGWLTGEEGAEGTADVLFFRPDSKSVEVWDLKTGYVDVSPIENKQLMLYALGAMAEAYDTEQDAKFVIWQGGDVKTWSATSARMIEFSEEVQVASSSAMRQMETGPTEFCPSEQTCRGCPGLSTCPGARKVLTASFTPLLDAPVAERVDSLTLAQLGELMAQVPLVKQLCNAIAEKASSEMLMGHEIPGFKLVQGHRGARRWSDEAAVEQRLLSMRVSRARSHPKLLSPTGLEKIISVRRMKKLADLVVRPPGRPIVVPESDRRQSISTVEFIPVEIEDLL